jgi:hypothetical protein
LSEKPRWASQAWPGLLTVTTAPRSGDPRIKRSWRDFPRGRFRGAGVAASRPVVVCCALQRRFWWCSRWHLPPRPPHLFSGYCLLTLLCGAESRSVAESQCGPAWGSRRPERLGRRLPCWARECFERPRHIADVVDVSGLLFCRPKRSAVCVCCPMCVHLVVRGVIFSSPVRVGQRGQ